MSKGASRKYLRTFRQLVKRASLKFRADDGTWLEPEIDDRDFLRVCRFMARYGAHACNAAIEGASGELKVQFNPYIVEMIRLAAEEEIRPGSVDRMLVELVEPYSDWVILKRLHTMSGLLRACDYTTIASDDVRVWIDGRYVPLGDAVFELSDVICRRWRITFPGRARPNVGMLAHIIDSHGNIVVRSIALDVARHIVALHNTWVEFNLDGFIHEGKTRIVEEAVRHRYVMKATRARKAVREIVRKGDSGEFGERSRKVS